ncbi:MAG: hypothetical protein EA397_12545 [Deltaproteobacteria bacterium]|nr:MAG: hypothetical protein EA397_12545 [Deltaproteobacteria bacterium]
MRICLLALFAAGCFQPHLPQERPDNACEAGAWSPRETVITVKVGRAERRALVWFPPSEGPHDVVVNLHEFRSSPRTQVKYSGWAQHLYELDAILVAPDAKYAMWNAGKCCGRSVDKLIDDVAYLNAVVKRLDEVACTSGNVLATGIGNGAMMAQMWACESDVPDAVVSVGGSLQWPECRNARPIPLLHYHGSDDTFIPLDGSATGLVAQENAPFNLDHALGLWVNRNAARASESVQAGALSCRQWTGKAPITSCIIEGGRDTWPGAADGAVASESPLANATTGAWAWVKHAWSKAPEASP